MSKREIEIPVSEVKRGDLLDYDGPHLYAVTDVWQARDGWFVIEAAKPGTNPDASGREQDGAQYTFQLAPQAWMIVHR